ncbi:MAG: 23S rRNA (uracil(1939)-C(5))-methyltransferase RlmD [Saprospiraceae bacterium]|nr:MAG: 23S rRNA (uracil(1939)-C(5))-methyltransferase RlmD [Saprospiraceae bacterium]
MGKRQRKPIIVQEIEITGMADKGRGVGRDAAGCVIFVEHVAPGDVVDAHIVKKKKDYMEGFAIHYHKLSEHRIEPFCEHFSVCGGCRWQHLSYPAQTHYKERVVRDTIFRIARITPEEFLPIVPCDHTTYYRNKLEYAFSDKRWLTKDELNTGASNQEDVLGFHRPGAFDKIVDIKHCWLQPGPSNELRLTAKAVAIEQGLSFFDLWKNEGFMRHIMIRLSSIGELMLIVSFFEDDQPKIKRYLNAVIEKMPQLTSVFYCINQKMNDYVLDLDMISYHGKPYIEEQLGHVRFKIGPKSFFQTNSYQAKVLYDKVVEFAGLSGEENVYDLYTGVGSIALYVAKYCKQVVGIEEVPEAIVDAGENARMNGTTNCTFYAGDVRDILTSQFAEKHGKPDLVITDPPRAGMHTDVVKMFLQLEAPKIVYVSCNPATQARDISLLKEKYDLLKIQPVDMFPHTHHVETVALLALRSSALAPEEILRQGE